MLSMFGVKDYVIAGLVALLLVVGGYYKVKVSGLETEVATLTGTVQVKMAEIEMQNAAIKQMEVDHEAKLKESVQVKTEIETKYKVVYKTIDRFVKDENATDCDNLRKFASTVVW